MSLVLVAGSTQIDVSWLALVQLLLGVYYATLGAIAGWQAARD
jgi:hypothetical protein